MHQGVSGPHLHELQALDGQLAEDVGVAVKEHMPEVVDLTGPRQHIRKLGIIHKPGHPQSSGSQDTSCGFLLDAEARP